MFSLSDKQLDKLHEWTKTKDMTIYTGAIGGRFTYCFTPTSIGVFIKVQDFIDKTEISLDDGEDF